MTNQKTKGKRQKGLARSPWDAKGAEGHRGGRELVEGRGREVGNGEWKIAE